MSLIFVDCEGYGCPGVNPLREFGAVEYTTRKTFHGKDCSEETFTAFKSWLGEVSTDRPIMISDNPAFDFQWINHYFWVYFGDNPFGHSARRISDFYAGLCGDFRKTQQWKRLRRTPHDHNPVHDAMGNAEAFERILAGER